MKRRISSFLILLLVLGLGGCAKEEGTDDFVWTEEDFYFYDSNDKAVVFPTVDDSTIWLSEMDDLHTSRRIEIGDRATEIAKRYDVTEFSWFIDDDELHEKYQDKGKTVSDILELLPEIDAKGAKLSIFCRVYLQNGKLCSQSELDLSQKDSDETYAQYDDPTRTAMLAHDYLTYTMVFFVEEEAVSNVMLTSWYHENLKE